MPRLKALTQFRVVEETYNDKPSAIYIDAWIQRMIDEVIEKTMAERELGQERREIET